MKKEYWEPLWNVVNKPIFIWFLATIVVGLVSFGYDHVQNEREIGKAERKIDLEIAARLMYARIFYFPEAYAVGHVRGISEDIKEPRDDILTLGYRGFAKFREALDVGTAFGAFPEFKARSLESLIWELATLRNAKPAGQLKEALHASMDISRQKIFWMNRQNFRSGAHAATGVSARAAIVAEIEELEKNYAKLRLPRWDSGVSDVELQKYTPQLNLPELAN